MVAHFSSLYTLRSVAYQWKMKKIWIFHGVLCWINVDTFMACNECREMHLNQCSFQQNAVENGIKSNKIRFIRIKCYHQAFYKIPSMHVCNPFLYVKWEMWIYSSFNSIKTFHNVHLNKLPEFFAFISLSFSFLFGFLSSPDNFEQICKYANMQTNQQIFQAFYTPTFRDCR